MFIDPCDDGMEDYDAICNYLRLKEYPPCTRASNNEKSMHYSPKRQSSFKQVIRTQKDMERIL